VASFRHSPSSSSTLSVRARPQRTRPLRHGLNEAARAHTRTPQSLKVVLYLKPELASSAPKKQHNGGNDKEPERVARSRSWRRRLP
jgi:hypothetical protein